MNSQHPVTPDDETIFDRLADGELSPDDYRQLLASLDDRPDGWRRCALAFLEAQALATDLQAVRDRVDRQAARAQRRPGRWRSLPAGLGSLLAVAAGLLVAFGLGVAASRWWPASPTVPVADQQPEQRIAESPEQPVVQPQEQLVEVQPPAELQPAEEGRQPLGHVRLVMDGADGAPAEPVEIPFFELEDFDPDWLTNQAFSLPPELVELLRRTGHEIRRDHRLVPVDLQDGRRVMIPVEQVEIVPVRGSSFQ